MESVNLNPLCDISFIVAGFPPAIDRLGLLNSERLAVHHPVESRRRTNGNRSVRLRADFARTRLATEKALLFRNNKVAANQGVKMLATRSFSPDFDDSKEAPHPTRVLIADEHPLTIMGLRNAIAEHQDLQICAECSDWPELLRNAQEHTPDIIVLSEELYSVGCADYPELLSKARSEYNVLLLSSRRDVQLHRDALCAGVKGILLKHRPTSYVARAIRAVQKGGLWFERAVTDQAVLEFISRKQRKPDPDEAKIASLTQREREVICLISQGLKNKEIASRLFISGATVSHHLTSIFRKLEVSDRLLLVIYAFRKNLAPLS